MNEERKYSPPTEAMLAADRGRPTVDLADAILMLAAATWLDVDVVTREAVLEAYDDFRSHILAQKEKASE